MLKMSVELLLENVEKPWANLRVNDLVVDGSLTVAGALDRPGGVIEGVNPIPVTTIMGVAGAFYEVNMTGAGLTAGSLTDFTASNLSAIGPRLTYTGDEPTNVNVFFALTVKKLTAASNMNVVVTKNGVEVFGSEAIQNNIGTASFVQFTGAATRVSLVNGDVIRLSISSADINSCVVEAFNLQVY